MVSLFHRATINSEYCIIFIHHHKTFTLHSVAGADQVYEKGSIRASGGRKYPQLGTGAKPGAKPSWWSRGPWDDVPQKPVICKFYKACSDVI